MKSRIGEYAWAQLGNQRARFQITSSLTEREDGKYECIGKVDYNKGRDGTCRLVLIHENDSWVWEASKSLEDPYIYLGSEYNIDASGYDCRTETYYTTIDSALAAEKKESVVEMLINWRWDKGATHVTKNGRANFKFYRKDE